ncbi:MAG: hypothetical protein PHC62_06900 [Candidatus Izemoplasmatales bacterium]|nr:hypothetical protein [Candidatus Izemoplasmatales bacterium]
MGAKFLFKVRTILEQGTIVNIQVFSDILDIDHIEASKVMLKQAMGLKYLDNIGVKVVPYNGEVEHSKRLDEIINKNKGEQK